MNIKQIIPANHHLHRKEFQKDGNNFLNISEFFCNSIQGEGVYTGHPAAFLRLQGCNVGCNWCDTTNVWRYGTPWSFEELFKRMETVRLARKLYYGQHLVITGGSPLLQQDRLVNFLNHFQSHFGFYPFTEIENECTIIPLPELISLINVWNNSPKLFNSGVLFKYRYNAVAIRTVAVLSDSWFKFVVDKEEDWHEIFANFIKPGLVSTKQIILMPEGASREQLDEKRDTVIMMAVRHKVRYSDRLQIVTWNKTVGV